MAPIADIPNYYTVTDGDTLSSIAGTLWTDLVATVNHLTDPDMVEAGQSLLIPALGRSLWVTINEGDTLTSITGTRLWPSLYVENQDSISLPNQIQAGQVLNVPKLVAEVPPLD